MKEFASIAFRLPRAVQIFKVTTAMPESELLPLIMSISWFPGFWDADTAELFKWRILTRTKKELQIKRLTAAAAAKYPKMNWDTHTDLFRFLAVKLPIYATAKKPTRITSEELPDYLEAINMGSLLKHYDLDELFLAFVLLGYPVYANETGWDVGLQILGSRTLKGVLEKARFVGRAKIDIYNNFNSSEV
jgi:hypothetical protein